MTVAELIELLQKLPQDVDVIYRDDYDLYKVSRTELIEYTTVQGVHREVEIG